MKKVSVFLMVVIITASMAACKGDAGPEGPQGPKGDQGERGPAGATGPAGANGAAGATGATGAAGPKGDKGDTGATGAVGAPGPKGEKGDKGDTGATGATGTAGPKGDKGDTGSANVIYSGWISMTNASLWTTNSGGAYWTANFAAPAITQAVLDRGVILIYTNSTGFGTVLLPLKLNPARTFQAYTKLQRIYIEQVFSSGATTTFPGTGGLNEFRYVIIPGGVAGGRQAPVDYNDYEAVKKYYNLPD